MTVVGDSVTLGAVDIDAIGTEDCNVRLVATIFRNNV